MIGTLALTGASPPRMSKSNPTRALRSGLDATHDRQPSRETVTRRKAQDEMQLWQQKLHDFDAKAGGQGWTAQTSLQRSGHAWTEPRMRPLGWRRLARADWASAKVSFQTASHKLAVAWQKVNPADK
jgi:hypothetical protein